MAYSDRYLLFIEYFNKQRYQSAQTALDDLWLDEEGTDKDFHGGLIQVAVALFHLTNENPEGAHRVYLNAKQLLAGFGDRYQGLDVRKLLSDLDELFSKHVNAENGRKDYRGVLPSIEFQNDSL
ncbi:MAG: DUF309 domain-containing protein [Pseudomonadota bacterium]